MGGVRTCLSRMAKSAERSEGAGTVRCGSGREAGCSLRAGLEEDQRGKVPEKAFGLPAPRPSFPGAWMKG